jgi:hypothetical protein
VSSSAAEPEATVVRARPMKVGDYLRAPFVIRAQSVELPSGEWVARFEYPELPGCVVEGASVSDTLAAVDRKRVELILELLREGRPPLVTRPLRDAGMVRAELRQSGLWPVVEHVVDIDAASLATVADSS